MKKLLLTTALVCASTTATMAQTINVPACTDCHVSLAPSGIMSDHLHKPGEYMLSYTFMRMDMGGNRNGTNELTPEQVITFANPNPGPANLRVVPTDMTMDMHMLGGMIGLTDKVTGMIMVNYLDNSMDHITFNAAGTARIGTFNTKSKGFGDTEIGAITSLYKDGAHGLNGQFSLSLPTGSITEKDDVLAPDGSTPTLRLPYMMQLGTGTYDLKPTLTYTYLTDKWTFGGSYSARLHVGRNSEGYMRGDWHELATWAGYQYSPTLGVSSSLKFRTEQEIDGADTQIAAPVQTADPNNYGGQKLHLGLQGSWKFYEQNQVKASVSVPLYQNLHGPQMEDDYAFSLRWQNSF